MQRPKTFKVPPKRRFAVGAKVFIKLPGIHGVVKQVDDQISSMGQYWHIVETEFGDRREPGSILELVPRALTNEESPRSPHNIHVHGDHSRINVHSTDNSTNYISEATNDQLFVQLKEAACGVSDDATRDAIIARIDEMDAAQRSGTFVEAYQRFVGVAADHLTLFMPFLPLLTQMLSGH